MTSLAGLPDLVLGPLHARSDDECQKESGDKWSPAQIVEHLALGLEWSAQKFEERRGHAPMARRPRRPIERVARFLILGLRWFPPGRKAPERSVPARITRAAAEAHFRAGLAHWERLSGDLLPTRRNDLFVKHPRLGDLTIEEWTRFHGIHARHHARQIRQRLAG